VARDATARLYDVDASSITMDKKAGVITFQAKKGRLVDLDRLHESIWATRLGDRTGMELRRLEVTVVGEVVFADNNVLLKVPGSDQHFVLGADSKAPAALGRLEEAVRKGEKVLRVTGQVEGWTGNLTRLTSKLPARPRRILVSEFQPVR
jgi:hypothetical protein